MAVAEKFKSFFIDKIRLIRDRLLVNGTGIRNDLLLDNSVTQSWPCEFATFQRVPSNAHDFLSALRRGSRIF